MRHRKKKITVDRASHQRRTLWRNLANSLISRERLVTTPVKAKAVRAMVEKMVTLAKRPNLDHRRRLIQALADDQNAKKMLEVIGPRFQSRPGGYTRLVKTKSRSGDQAEQVVLEFTPSP